MFGVESGPELLLGFLFCFQSAKLFILCIRVFRWWIRV